MRERLAADVVVVGGGAVGTSAAYHLAASGVTDVVVVEQHELGSGSTGKSAGGIRAQFADELNIRIALRSIESFAAFHERFGVDIAFRQVGYLFLLVGDDDVDRFREALELQRSLGVPSTELPVAEAARLVPGVVVDDVVAATFCPLDGYATPESVVGGYAAAAARLGVRFRQHDAVGAVDVVDGQIVAVETTTARIETDVVVCAAGAWSGDVARLAGVELPVVGERRWLHYSPENAGVPEDAPMTIDFATGFYFHREGQGLVFGGREEALEDLAEPASRRFPPLADLPVQASWWGYYEMSPDHNAFVGETRTPSRFLYATGFSGHGFQQAPAVGEYLAALVTGAEPALDLSPFSLERFEVGVRRAEPFVI